ncbi:asparagine--tRNA ligase, cytoplasmic 2 [Tanacetum coccineum]
MHVCPGGRIGPVDKKETKKPQEAPVVEEEAYEFVDYRDRKEALAKKESTKMDVDLGLENAASGLIIRKRKQVEETNKVKPGNQDSVESSSAGLCPDRRSLQFRYGRLVMVASVMKVSSALNQSSHTFFQNQGFVHVEVPIITATDNGAFSENFRVKVSHYGSISLIVEPCRSTHLKAMEVTKEAGALLNNITATWSNVWSRSRSGRKGRRTRVSQLHESQLYERALAYCDPKLTSMLQHTGRGDVMSVCSGARCDIIIQILDRSPKLPDGVYGAALSTFCNRLLDFRKLKLNEVSKESIQVMASFSGVLMK